MSHASLTGHWSWDPSYPLPTELSFASADNMQQWSMDTRMLVTVQEIISTLCVTPHHASETPDAQGQTVPTPATVRVLSRLGSGEIVVAQIDRPGMEAFAQQLNYIEYYADQRVERAAEILLQLTDILSSFGAVVPLEPERNRWTHELLLVALQAASLIEMQCKHLLACQRPNVFSAQVHPMIQTPGHGTLPSGHATEAFLVATILRDLVMHAAVRPYLVEQQLLRQATRIAQNRTVAGVHFPVDSAAGATLGISLARYILALAHRPEGTSADHLNVEATGWHCRSDAFGAADFTHETSRGLFDHAPLVAYEGDGTEVEYGTPTTYKLTMSNTGSVLRELYARARAEWATAKTGGTGS
ncbi:phosphatase PAP2 family protein [Puniceibacterium sediminis]|nr:phosphatase PAP2 family protein [Puniceibacterium sediminis]